MSETSERAAAVREHIARLAEAVGEPIGPMWLARTTGIAPAVLSTVLRGRAGCSAETAEIVTATRPRDLLAHRGTMSLRVPEETRQVLAEAAEATTMSAVAAACGVSHDVVSRVHGDPDARVAPEIAQRLATVTVDAAVACRGGVRWVDREPSVTRIRALQAAGWGLDDVAARSGGRLTRRALDSVVRARTPRLASDVAEAVLEVYEAFGGEEGPSDRSRRVAAARGYTTPGWYDDDMRRLTPLQRDPEADRARLLVAILTVHEVPFGQIVERTGMSRSAVQVARKETGLTTVLHPEDRTRRVLPPEAAPIVRVVRVLARGVAETERTMVLDDDGIDYWARVRCLRRVTRRVKTARAAAAETAETAA